VGDTDGVTDAEGARSKGRSRQTSGSPAAASGEEGGGRRRKKRKLERKGQAVRSSGKYKSNEMVEDSDEDGDGSAPRDTSPAADSPLPGMEGEDDEEDAAVARATRKKAARVLDEDEDEDGVDANGAGGAPMDVDGGDEERVHGL